MLCVGFSMKFMYYSPPLCGGLMLCAGFSMKFMYYSPPLCGGVVLCIGFVCDSSTIFLRYVGVL